MAAQFSLRSYVRSVFVLFSKLVAISVLACVGSTPALAQTDTFISGSGMWSEDENWSLDQVPVRTNDCVLPANSVVTSDLAGECANFTLGAGGALTLTPGYLFVYSSSLVNQGVIAVGPGNGLAFAQPSVTTTITGGGTINLTNASSVFTGSGNTVINADNTIHGQGFMEVTQFTNHALIDANVAGGSLQLHAGVPTGIVNTGTIQASNGATLQLTPQSLGTAFNNTGGIIQALNGSIVQLQGYNFTGGTLVSSGTGVLQEVNTAGLNNLTNNSNYQLIGGNITILQGTIVNNATFTAQHGGFQINGTVTLKGSGSVTGGDSAFIKSACCNPANLINLQPIQGGGNIGDSSFTLTNQATVNANNPASPLVLSGTPAFNTGTIEATNGATLDIRNVVNNTGGTISAQNGSTVLLDNTATINGGTLTTTGTGTFQTSSGTLDGTVNVPTNAGLFTVAQFNNLLTKGTINNTGTIALGGCIGLEAPTTITGSGQVTMAPNSCFLTFSSGLTLTNQSTISGAGSIGDSNPMPIANKGMIIANQSTPLLIVPDATGFSNTGTLVANAGSVLSIQGLFKNFAKNTLTGGTYSVAGTLQFQNANIVTNSANITLTGGAAKILNSFTNTSALANLATNSAKGVLSLQGGQVLSSGASVSNQGKLTIGTGSGFGVSNTYTQTAGTTTVDGVLTAPAGISLNKGSLVGLGVVAASVTSSASVTAGDLPATPGKLTVNGSYTQTSTGTLNISVGGLANGSFGQLAVSNGVSLSGTTLSIKRVNHFLPKIGDTFAIVTAGALSGQFVTVRGASINSGEHFQVNYSATGVTLKVVSGP